MCFYLVGDVQVERSKNEQRVAERSQKKQFWAKYENMSRHGFVMPHHEMLQSKTRGWHVATYPIHAAACQGGGKTIISRHPAA